MKQFLLITAAIVLAIIALSSIGPMIGMAISALIVYYSLKKFTATNSTGAKVCWAILGLIGFSGLLANLPALAGIAAVYILYTGYKHWKSDEMSSKQEDPFAGFDKEWKKLQGLK
ncbi:flagellar basal body rod protein [Lederbergia graminis]|uniref:Flagellar basal body rod protein n=1 Tax=Lederbergia graminis TaxID=735518 RepID=A0ABW0LDY8_9BACI|nr:flagellar basal body rod protein [Paenibacillus bovis]HLU23413.1 flagellar basal body rod protein [Bacillaceae bacterium]